MKVLFFKALKIFLALFAIIIVIVAIYAFLAWPVNNVRKDSLRAKIHIPTVVKNIPVSEACSEPLYTYVLPDCGAGACPNIYKIRYETQADEVTISKSMEDYIKSLDGPYEYTLEINIKMTADTSCSGAVIQFFSSEY